MLLRTPGPTLPSCLSPHACRLYYFTQTLRPSAPGSARESKCLPTPALDGAVLKGMSSQSMRRLRKFKEEAYRSGDRDLFKQTRNTLNREVRKARRCYGESLKRHLSANPDPSTVWKGLQSITGFKKRTSCGEPKTPRPHSRSARRKCARCSGDKRPGRHRAQTAFHLPA
ncbi:uncharacterized protein ACBT44_007478 isoform 1-T1 [Syngnathus typhle]